MRVSVLLLCLAVLLAALLPETSGGVSRRRGGKGRRGGIKGRALPNLRRKLARRGRQDEDAPEEALNDLDEAAADDYGGSGSGEELPNGCDPNTNIGGFLVFKGVKIWCGEQGITDFGPYGGLPVEDGSGEASDVEGEEVEAPEEEVVRRGRKARRGRKGNKKAARRGKQAKGKKGRKGRKATQKKAGKGRGRGRQANNRRG